MILVNFGHPLTEFQRAEAATMARQPFDRVLEAETQFDTMLPFAPQAVSLVHSVGLSGKEWQTEPLMVNLPSLSVIAALVLAELHGRCGYFPPVIRLRSSDGFPPRFEVAEILNLQIQRDESRRLRSS